MCHSHRSSSMLPNAAPMPPCAVPVWERVGYSLVSTATLPTWPSSRAARRPAPPAPTITASKEWYIIALPVKPKVFTTATHFVHAEDQGEIRTQGEDD